MREEDKGSEAVGGGLWTREGFMEEVAGGVPECPIPHTQCKNTKALKTEGCFINLLAAKLDLTGGHLAVLMSPNQCERSCSAADTPGCGVQRPPHVLLRG